LLKLLLTTPPTAFLTLEGLIPLIGDNEAPDNVPNLLGDAGRNAPPRIGDNCPRLLTTPFGEDTGLSLPNFFGAISLAGVGPFNPAFREPGDPGSGCRLTLLLVSFQNLAGTINPRAPRSPCPPTPTAFPLLLSEVVPDDALSVSEAKRCSLCTADPLTSNGFADSIALESELNLLSIEDLIILLLLLLLLLPTIEFCNALTTFKLTPDPANFFPSSEQSMLLVMEFCCLNLPGHRRCSIVLEFSA
jgi:hypothetical protein